MCHLTKVKEKSSISQSGLAPSSSFDLTKTTVLM